MRSVSKTVILVNAVCLVAASLTLAKTKEPSSQIRVAFLTTLADGTQLEPGPYNVTLFNETSSPQIAFYKGTKLVCKCPVKLEDAGKKISATQISYVPGEGNAHKMTVLEIRGWTQKVILTGSGG